MTSGWKKQEELSEVQIRNTISYYLDTWQRQRNGTQSKISPLPQNEHQVLVIEIDIFNYEL